MTEGVATGQSDAQFPFEIASLASLLLRFIGIVAIREHVAIKGGSDTAINRKIIESLRLPSDGIWLDLARYLLLAEEAGPLTTALRESLGIDKKRNARLFTRLDRLVAFRNRLMHGARLDDVEYTQAWEDLDTALNACAPLSTYHLVVRTQGSQVFVFEGSQPTPFEHPHADLPLAHPCLLPREGEGAFLDLHPLLVYRDGDGDGILDYDELFFLNQGETERVSYITHSYPDAFDGRQLNSYEDFRAFMDNLPSPPIPRDPRIDFSAMVERHTRLFTGREDLLKEVEDSVKESKVPYLALRALAGMGKSAVMAELCRRHEMAIGAPQLECTDRWVFHFCMSQGARNDPMVALRNLMARICDTFNLNRRVWLVDKDDELKDQYFPALLSEVTRHLPEGRRLVVAVDALDEGFSPGRDSVASILPSHVVDRVIFLISWRVDEHLHAPRVERALGHLDPEKIHHLKLASPLIGLTRDDVNAFLTCANGGHPASSTFGEEVWQASTQKGKLSGADPFYLTFVSEGLAEGQVIADRPETVPATMEDAFDQIWLALPTDRQCLLQRVLITLGIMFEYGSDELFAELFNGMDEVPFNDLVPQDIARLRIHAGKLLSYDGENYGLFHDRFKFWLVGVQKDPLDEVE